jgi:hypothetical protein
MHTRSRIFPDFASSRLPPRVGRTLSRRRALMARTLRDVIEELGAAGASNSTNVRLIRQKSTLFQWLAVPLWFPTVKDSVPKDSGHSVLNFAVAKSLTQSLSWAAWHSKRRAHTASHSADPPERVTRRHQLPLQTIENRVRLSERPSSLLATVPSTGKKGWQKALKHDWFSRAPTALSLRSHYS